MERVSEVSEPALFDLGAPESHNLANKAQCLTCAGVGEDMSSVREANWSNLE